MCDRVASVAVGADCIQADDFTGHLESGYLLAPVLMKHLGLERAAANGEQRLKFVAAAVEIVAVGEPALLVTKIIQLQYFIIAEVYGKA